MAKKVMMVMSKKVTLGKALLILVASYYISFSIAFAILNSIRIRRKSEEIEKEIDERADRLRESTRLNREAWNDVVKARESFLKHASERISELNQLEEGIDSSSELKKEVDDIIHGKKELFSRFKGFGVAE